MTRINLNEVIKVKLTDRGKYIYFHRYDDLNRCWGRTMIEPSYPAEDEEGYSAFQLWNFMNIYGPHMGLNSESVISPLEMVYDPLEMVHEGEDEEMTEGRSQEVKADAGKPQLTLVPRQIIWDIAEVREYGNKKYHDPENWRRVEVQRYRDALLRHLLKYLDDPDSKDEESGISHLSHAATNMAFLCEMEHNPNFCTHEAPKELK